MALHLRNLPLVIISYTNPLQTHDYLAKTHLKNPNFSSKLLIKPLQFVSKSAKLRSKSNNDKVEGVEFTDEKGAVDDMEGYLNSLSLEYDSVWDTKPSWCQPWTIALTGVSVVACSWLILHSIIVTVLASSLISAWWYIFLYSYPKAYSDMIAERRKRVSGGLEDTYGLIKNQ
ncbi:hypothetical protein RND81_13G141900 [Saponaria officinalis]|uniref:DUF6737 domain-containing protein n=1 Tax=Saponaria officinalis TaxID=3572 RepID=A0AAW1H681_SAPOF